MREAIGGTWIFQIVIFFILLFTGFMCLSINHSKAFNVKNNIIKTIEREEEVNLSNPKDDKAIKQIVEYLKKVSYRTTGSCEDKGELSYTAINREGDLARKNDAAFCIAKVSTASGSDMPDMAYYSIIVFYQLDLPIFRSVFNFKVSGDTRILMHSYEVSR